MVEAPDFTGGKFEEARYLLHIRQLLAWAREHGTVSLASGDIICRESMEKGDFMEDYYFCLVPPGTQGWPLRVRPGGTYAVLYHQGSYQSEYAACRRLWEWVHAQGYPVDGDLYEENLVDYTTSEAVSYTHLDVYKRQGGRPEGKDGGPGQPLPPSGV